MGLRSWNGGMGEGPRWTRFSSRQRTCTAIPAMVGSPSRWWDPAKMGQKIDGCRVLLLQMLGRRGTTCSGGGEGARGDEPARKAPGAAGMHRPPAGAHVACGMSQQSPEPGGSVTGSGKGMGESATAQAVPTAHRREEEWRPEQRSRGHLSVSAGGVGAGGPQHARGGGRLARTTQAWNRWAGWGCPRGYLRRHGAPARLQRRATAGRRLSRP